jgi:predicted dehydrogenase
MSALRVGIAGYGLAGEVFHAPLVAAAEGLAVAGVVTGNAERAARAQAAHPDAEVVGHVDELWNRIDLLVIAAPNDSHVPLALAAVERGVPVVVDKPLAVSADDGERLVDAAEAAGVPLTVFQNRRLDGDFLTVRRLLAEGRLGDVTRFESRFERFRPEVSAGAWREDTRVEVGGGLLLDLGPHLVDQARELFGPPVRLYAELGARRPGAQVDDDTFVALEHAGGVRSHLWMSAVAPLHGPRFAVSGTRAGFATNGLDPQEQQLEDGMRPGDDRYGVTAPGLLVDAEGSEEVALERGAYERFYGAVPPWLRGEAPAPVDPRDSVAVMRLLDAARTSAATNSVIELEDSQ